MIRLFALVVVLFIYLHMDNNVLIDDVKSGRLQLICNDKPINPDLIDSYSGGVWWFKNGHAKNCKVSN